MSTEFKRFLEERKKTMLRYYEPIKPEAPPLIPKMPPKVERYSTEGLLSLEDEEKLFLWIYDLKPHPSPSEVNDIYGRWLIKRGGTRR